MTEQEAYDNLMGYINEIGTIGVEYWTRADADRMIESVNRLYFEEDEPSGEWVNIGGQYFSQGGYSVVKCSKCGGGQHPIGIELHGYRYCPDCGSRNYYKWEKDNDK